MVISESERTNATGCQNTILVCCNIILLSTLVSFRWAPPFLVVLLFTNHNINRTVCFILSGTRTIILRDYWDVIDIGGRLVLEWLLEK
jgi:hypothetical protein